MLKIGLLGAGRIAGVHATAISAHPKSELAAVSDYFPDAAAKVAAQYGSMARSTEDIIADDTIDAVLIATSTDTHADLIKAATEAGKSVLCEKPVDLDLNRAKTCLIGARKAGQPVMMGFNRRFDPNFVALKQALQDGEIGKPELLTLTSYDPAPPPIEYVKVSGGLFRDMMTHDFDMAHFIMGALPVSVSAIGSCQVDPAIGAAGDVDTAVATLTYADGRIAVIKNSRRAVYGYDQRIEILGSEGLLQANNVLDNTVVKSTTAGVAAANPKHFFLERYMPAYAAEWAAFMDALTSDAALPVTLEDGVAALAVGEAAIQSAASGASVELAGLLEA